MIVDSLSLHQFNLKMNYHYLFEQTYCRFEEKNILAYIIIKFIKYKIYD